MRQNKISEVVLKKIFVICFLLIALIVSTPFTFAATLNLIYDKNGNLVTGDGKYREYDGFNHLVRIRNGSTSSDPILEEYVWDLIEDKIAIKNVYEDSDWKETVYYVSKTFVRVENASGIFDYKYVYQNGQLIAQELIGSEKHFILTDHLGSATVVTNESGAVVEETWYSPFGEVITGGATSRFDYEGKEFDSVVGDYDFHARKMNPEWGVFLQPDTIIQNVYDPQMLNRYAFERNNPYGYVDPDGHYLLALFEAAFNRALVWIMMTFGPTAHNLAMRGFIALPGWAQNRIARSELVYNWLTREQKLPVYGPNPAFNTQQSIDPQYQLEQAQLQLGQSFQEIPVNYVYSSLYLEMNPQYDNADKTTSQGQSRYNTDTGTGGSSSGNRHSYTDPNDYPEDPQGVCGPPEEVDVPENPYTSGN